MALGKHLAGPPGPPRSFPEHKKFSGALLSLSGILSPLMKPSLLTPSHGFSAQVLTVLCNIAEKGPAYCQQLHQQPALPLLLPTLALPDPEVVGQCLELLHLLFLHWPEVRAGGVPAPESSTRSESPGMGIIITI